MLNSRRAILAAACLLTIFFLISRTSHPSPTTWTAKKPSSKAAATEQEAAGVVDNGVAGISNSNSNSNNNNWPERKPVAQKPMMDTSNMSLWDKLAYAYPYDIKVKFPAFIWQTWKTTPSDGNFPFRDQEASWSEQHPGFIHEVVTDNVAHSLLRLFYASVPEVLEAYQALPLPVHKADFFRYLILFARGGIYSDIDTSALKSALEWIPADVSRDTVGLVVGIEADPDRPDWAQWYSRRIQFCQWTIQSKPGHPVLRDIIARITNDTLTMKHSGRMNVYDGKHVVDLTGPAIWTDTIMDYFNDERFFDTAHSLGKIDWHNFTGMETSKRVGDVVVLPITSFSPGVEQMGAKDDDDPMAFVKHDFEGTWKPDSERHIGGQQP
ncbi:hypothetical protein CDD81_6428 [Ophiocordyceps australis]|uniref:Initiation-specific alpha-1,6-mannosyltransferase n=1 Tax=Ophiocordyceps australis TaxID=1399860 RepID=A0A2C5YI55_9HYPO|nr:hypothetical protein CDD81_6428 [Ophiocordyceps australis]